MENGKVKQVLGIGTRGRKENVGKDYRRVNIVEVLRIHVRKWKKKTC
jgi:hypothetical protein